MSIASTCTPELKGGIQFDLLNQIIWTGCGDAGDIGIFDRTTEKVACLPRAAYDTLVYEGRHGPAEHRRPRIASTPGYFLPMQLTDRFMRRPMSHVQRSRFTEP